MVMVLNLQKHLKEAVAQGSRATYWQEMNKGGTSLNKTSSKYRINLMCGTGTESMWCQEVSLQGNVPLQTLVNNQSLCTCIQASVLVTLPCQ